jgi:hypothetical protein
MREVIRTINGCSLRYIPILRDVLVEDPINLILLGKRGGLISGRKTMEIESGSGCGMSSIKGG